MNLPRTIAVAAAVPLLLAMAASEAMGHVRLVSSSPSQSDTLAVAPSLLLLVYSEPVQPALTSVVLVGPLGDTIAISAPRLEGSSDRRIVADVPGRLGPGNYVVVWRTVSLDGHPVSGRIPFLVEQPPAAEDVDPDSPFAQPDEAVPPQLDAPETEGFHVLSPPFVAIRFLGYAGVLGIFGAVAFLLVVLPAAVSADPEWAEAGSEASWRARRWGAIAALVFLLAAVARLVAQGTALAGPAGADIETINAIVLESVWGRAWIVQVASGFLLMAFIAAGERRWARIGAAALLPVLAVSLGAAGHALSSPWPPVLVASSHAVHLLGAGVWLGSLAMVMFAGFPTALSHGRKTSALMASLVAVFSPVALACGALVVATGVVTAAAHLGSVQALWGTDYGRTLVIKLGLVALVVGVGAYNWRRTRPALAASSQGSPLRKAGRLELAFALLVLLLTAVLVATPPPT